MSSLRLTAANSEYLSITTGLIDHNELYTFAGWINFASLIGAAHILDIAVGDGYDNFDALWVEYGGTNLAISSFNAGSGGDDLSGSTTLSAGVWYHIALTRHSKTSLTCRVNAVSDALSVATDVTGRSAADRIELGRYVGAGNYQDARYWGWKAWQRALTDAELSREMHTAMPGGVDGLYGVWPFLAGDNRAGDLGGQAHNWTEFNTPTDEEPPNVSFSFAEPISMIPTAGVTAYTLTAESAPFALTAQAAVLDADRRVTADSASFAYTAQAAGLDPDFRVVAASAPYTFTAQDANFFRVVEIDADSASYAFTAQAAVLDADFRVTADSAPYTFTAQDVDFRKGFTITAETSTFAFTAQDGVLRAAYLLTAASGGFVFTAQDVTLLFGTGALSVVTAGELSAPVQFFTGDEWYATFTLPAADNVKLRVELRYSAADLR